MKNFDPSKSPAYQLWLATNAWQRLVRKALEPLDVTHCQFVIMASIDLLHNEGEPTSQVAVHRFAQIDENMTSQVVRTLMSKGFIARSPNPADKRGHILSLTESGTKLLETARGAVRPAVDEFFRPVGDDLEQLTLLLRKVNESENPN